MTYTYKEEIAIGGYVRFEYEHSGKKARDSMGQSLANTMDEL